MSFGGAGLVLVSIKRGIHPDDIKVYLEGWIKHEEFPELVGYQC